MGDRRQLANAIRALSMDAVQKAKSGHPGAPMGMADIAEVLWNDFLQHNPQDPKWAGRQLEVILAPGRALDQLTGRPRVIAAAELRSFDAYLAAMRDDRPGDGVFIAVVERANIFTDQTVATAEAPGSIERIARGADEARFRRREAVLPLWEKHLQPGKLFNTIIRRPLVVTE